MWRNTCADLSYGTVCRLTWEPLFSWIGKEKKRKETKNTDYYYPTLSNICDTGETCCEPNRTTVGTYCVMFSVEYHVVLNKE